MMPYQQKPVETFLRLLPRKVESILEVGSDVHGLVASELRSRTGALVVGSNPAPDFPNYDGDFGTDFPPLVRSDGRLLPFADESFDAVVSIATLEHVNGLEIFMEETARVLRPRGVFFTEFSPIWSSATGHHVYAKIGEKEARFWKPGKNPIPPYAHLLMSKFEMRQFLEFGPCADVMIEPIVRWIYDDDHINRCFFEDYMNAFRQGAFEIQKLKVFKSDVIPDAETAAKLGEKYSNNHTFLYSGMSAVLRKVSDNDPFGKSVFRFMVRGRREISDRMDEFVSFLQRNFPYLRILKSILTGRGMRSDVNIPEGF